MVKFKDFSRPLSAFQGKVLFSRTFQDSPVYSSTFQACANPETTTGKLGVNFQITAKLNMVYYKQWSKVKSMFNCG